MTGLEKIKLIARLNREAARAQCIRDCGRSEDDFTTPCAWHPEADSAEALQGGAREGM